jgi:hypothetical protein
MSLLSGHPIVLKASLGRTVNTPCLVVLVRDLSGSADRNTPRRPEPRQPLLALLEAFPNPSFHILGRASLASVHHVSVALHEQFLLT